MTTRSLAALGALNFFMADVRDGLGPFLGVYLQAQGWSPAQIGTVMTVGGLATVAATTPAGALVDRIAGKRAVMIVAALATIVVSFAILGFPGFLFTATTQVLSGIAGAIIPAAIAAITLGIVRQQGFARQLGRNEAFNHGGNLAAAVLAGGLGYLFALQAVFYVMAAMAILAARLAEQRGYWIVFLLALLALPIRGVIAALVTGPIGLVPVQVLDGVGAGLLGVAVPGLVARILAGTGHVNAGLGAVMTLHGVGAALSPALGGVIAERSGYPAAFLVLGAAALLALLLWIVARTATADACSTVPALVAAK